MSSESPKQEIERIQPLLQDERISDADLVTVLVEAGYAGLFLLALVLLSDPKLAEKAVINCISIVAAHRREYWGEVPLVVWANRLLIQACHQNRSSSKVRIRSGRDDLYTFDGYLNRESLSSKFLQRLAILDEQQRAVLALRYGQNLSLEEIAAILDFPTSKAHIYLKSARRVYLESRKFRESTLANPERGDVFHTAFQEQIIDATDGVLDADQFKNLERHLGQCQACRDTSIWLADGEAWLTGQFSNLLREGVNLKDLRHVVSECLKLADHRKRWKGINISGRQYLYIGALLALLFGVASRLLLPLETQLKPPAPPTATAYILTPDPWEGYFKFTYHASTEDSLEGLAERLGLPVKDIAEMNRMGADSSLYPGRVLNLAVPEASFFPPSQVPTLALPPPLTAQDDEMAILRRMAETKQLVGNLWGDFQVILYGPSGYSGPPFLASRMQVWWHQDGHMLVLSGINPPGRTEVYRQYSIPSGFTFNRDPSNGSYNGYQHQGEPDQYYFLNPSVLMGFEEAKATLEVVGSDHILGRIALVVDWIQEQNTYFGRLWIDVERGMVLRLRLFEDSSKEVTLIDIGFSDLALDVDLPAGIFSPNGIKPEMFAVDFTGQPQQVELRVRSSPWALPPDRRARERILPPEGFDPTREPLTLQWPMEDGESEEALVDVYADEYYMGSVNIGQGAISPDQGEFYASIPFNSCARSPDGRLVAVSISRLSSYEPRIYWFPIANPQALQFVITRMEAVSEFAFDPNSRYLAYFGCIDRECGIQLLDTYTGSIRILFSTGGLNAPTSLTWSPDGKFLAFLGNDSRGYSRQIFVIQKSSGVIVYQADYSWEAHSVPPDSPTLAWGIRFPADESFFPFVEGCRYPLEYPEWAKNDRFE